MSPDDIARLMALHPLLAPAFPAIAAQVYAAEPQRVALITWMSIGLLGPHDARSHDQRIVLPQPSMLAATSVVRTAYLDLILAAPLEAAPAIRAVNKLLDHELEIMVRHHEHAALIAREHKAQADRIKAMQTLAAGLAHEVRNPLNAAKLQLELLERRLRRETADERLTQPAELAQSEIQRLTELLNDFLAFARPLELELQDRDVTAILRHVCELAIPTAAARGIVIVTGIPDAPSIARVDGPKLHQVVENVVRNALEAVRDGGRIEVSMSTTPDALEIVIEDDGPGIPVELHARVYEPFFTTKDGGIGLGMSVVHSLISLHGGSIALTSSAQGTRFIVTLPRSPQRPSPNG